MNWSDKELSQIDIGDKRLNKRIKKTVASLSKHSGNSLPVCFKSRSELIAAYRAFDNELITPEKILTPHYKQTMERSQAHPVVLLLNDTSSIDYTSKKSVKGLGILEKEYTKGIFVHPTLAVTPNRECLGLIDHGMWIRQAKERGKKATPGQRAKKNIESKESFRWLQSYKNSCSFAMQSPATNFVFITDREGDMIELLSEGVATKQEVNVDILIRCKYDRIVLGKDVGKLFDVMEASPIVNQVEFELNSRNQQASRTVKQTIRTKQVVVKGKEMQDRTYPDTTINVVLCKEEASSAGIDPIVWLLLTTLPIETKEDVLNVVSYYLCRWEIETFFHVLKNGCRIEEKELKTVDRLKNMIALFMIVSWRIMYVMNLSRQQPRISCSEVFETAEWASVYLMIHKKKPKEAPTLQEFIILVARLGGYLPRKSPPGVETVWKGMNRMIEYAAFWETTNMSL